MNYYENDEILTKQYRNIETSYKTQVKKHIYLLSYIVKHR